MIARDLEQVVAIERQSFAYPWTEDDFRDALRPITAVGLVLEVAERIMGYIVYETHGTAIRIENLAVAPTWQRRGTGTTLIDHIKLKARQRRLSTIHITVSDANLSAHLFLKRQGFVAVGVFRECYAENNDSGYEFCFQADGSTIVPMWPVKSIN